MKRKLLLLCTFAILSVCSYAQESSDVISPKSLKFAYLSYDKALKALPDYALAQQSLANLAAKYEAEQKRVENDFNLKYEEFLDGQRDFPETILRKRQTELKELLERNVAFKNDIREQLVVAEAKLFEPLKNKLAGILSKIALEHGYAFILNTDLNAVPFINPAMGEDINGLVRQTIEEQNTVRSVIH